LSRVFACLLVLGVHLEAKPADPYIFERINNRNGLSSDFVSGIVQDQEGFMWFATQDGLNRYDGYSIKKYQNKIKGGSYFESDAFDCIEVAANGDLWLGTRHSGIYVFNPRTEEIKHISSDTSKSLFINDNQIQDLFCDSKGRVWISTYHGVSRFDPEKNRIVTYRENYNNPAEAPLGNVSIIYEDSKGRILFGTWEHGLYIYDEEKDEFRNLIINQSNVDPVGKVRIWSLMEDRYGYLWIGTWDSGLLQTRLLENSIQYIDHYYFGSDKQARKLCGNIIFALKQTEDNAIWVGASMGLNIITDPYEKNTEILLYSEENSNTQISKSEVYDIFQDISGSMWLATMGGGVNKVDLKRNRFELFTINDPKSALKSQVVNSFQPVSSSEHLLGVRGLGIGLYNYDKQSFTGFKDLEIFDGLPDNLNSVFYTMKDSRSNLWLGTRYLGLLRKDSESGSWETIIPRTFFSEGAPFSVNCMLEDGFNHIWVGTTEGLIRLMYDYDIAQYKIEAIIPDASDPTSIIGKNITSLLIDTEQVLWITTEDGGINRLVSGLRDDSNLAFENFDKVSGIPVNLRSNGANVIVEDDNNKLWIGTCSDGIIQYDRISGKVKTWSNILDLIGSSVYNIILDESNFLWLTTNKGLVRMSFDGEEINIHNFDYEDGLQGNIFNRGAWIKDDEGRIYLGGNYGINRFDPREFRVNNFIPPVVICDVKLNNKAVAIHRIENNELILDHDENNVVFTISALSYSQVRKNKFSYKLDGFDEDWIMTDYTNRNAVYTNIPPGKYTFLAKAANNSWIWNPDPVEFSITVKPLPLFSKAAIVLYVVLFFGIITLFFYVRFKSLKAQQALVIEKIERTKHDNINEFKLRIYTNISHELLTPLSLISHGIKEISENPATDRSLYKSLKINVKRLTVLINQLLDFRKLETGNMQLNVSLSLSDQIFKKVHDLYSSYAKQKHIDFQVLSNVDKLIYLDEDKLETILTNLVSNAFKYTGENGRIVISCTLESDAKKRFLDLNVSDTGIGIKEKDIEHIFERFYQAESNKFNSSGAGIGLHLVKNLVELHKGTISVKSDQDGMKTIFRVRIPVYKGAYSKDELKISRRKDNDLSSLVYDLDDFDETLAPGFPEIHARDKNFKVLVVEDNDELRRYIVNQLSEYYEVIEAPDGLKGYELALREHPDLIVSDLIMPERDGNEFCKKIKGNIDTNHIIFILLTGKISNADRSEGYLAGADSFLSKPLNIHLLLARIDSLKEQREKIKDKYVLGISDINRVEEISPRNLIFIKQITNEILSHMNNPELNVTMLAQKVHLSHSTLYRKIQSISGSSPNEFIRNIRINEAARLISSTDLNITEIIAQVGFNDHSYFTKCFKKKFNKTPKDYILSEQQVDEK